MKEGNYVTPTWGIETYYKDPTFNYYEDNNRVPIAGKVFDSYHPCEFVTNVQQIGGLSMAEEVVFTETPDKPLPNNLKDGLMQISDSLAVIVAGPGMKMGREYTL